MAELKMASDRKYLELGRECVEDLTDKLHKQRIGQSCKAESLSEDASHLESERKAANSAKNVMTCRFLEIEEWQSNAEKDLEEILGKKM